MLFLSVALSCGQSVDPAPATSQRIEPATVGVTSEALAALLSEHWNATMERFPTWASELGDRRFDGALYDGSADARRAWQAKRQVWLRRAEEVGSLDEADSLTRALLVAELRSGLDTDACAFETWSLSARSNAMVGANQLAESPRLDTMSDAEALLERYRALPASIDVDSENLRAGLANGRTGIAASIGKVVAMIEAQLALPIEESPLLGPLEQVSDDWSDVGRWRADLRAAVADGIRPALQRYVALLEEDVLPAAREGEAVGVHALPDGSSCYDALVQHHTTLDRSPDALHDLGLAELATIHDEFRTIGARVFETSELSEIFDRLRTAPELRFETAAEVEQTAKDALARAAGAMPEWFGRLPQAECIVEPIPDYLAPYTTIAYYQPARPDGSRPGTYFVNVYEPSTRPRHEAEVLAFHESVPGHHLQIAIAQELGELPAFRRYGHVTAFVEGWALYTERLSDEMGLYSGDQDRLGMLSFDAWRASRLVVDTGIHAKGWTRAQAEAFMRDNTPLAVNNIANEVDRYITTPGQALAYKVGQLEIRSLRKEAEEALGDRFDVAAFHDRILGAGPLPLPVLAERVRTWIVTAGGENLDTADGAAEPSP